MGRALDENILIRVSQEDQEAIRAKMEQAGIKNKSAYIRKMAVDGYVIVLDLSDVKEVIRLLRENSNNLKQFTKTAKETGIIDLEDINVLQTQQDKIWELVGDILVRLSNIT